MGRRRIDCRAGGGGESQRGQGVRTPRQRRAEEADGCAGARADRRPRRAEQQHLECGKGKGGCGGRDTRAHPVCPRRTQPRPPRQLADQQRYHREVQPGAREQVHEPARGHLVLHFAGQAGPVADCQCGHQRGPLLRGAGRRGTLGESGPQLVEPSPDAWAGLQDLDDLGASFDPDAARRELRATIAATGVQPSWRNVHLSEEPCPIAAMYGEPAQAQRDPSLGNPDDSRSHDGPLEILRQSKRRGLLLCRSTQKAQREAQCGGARGTPEGERQSRKGPPPLRRDSEIRARKKCRRCNQQRPDAHAPSPENPLRPKIRVWTAAREPVTLHPISDRRQAHP